MISINCPKKCPLSKDEGIRKIRCHDNYNTCTLDESYANGIKLFQKYQKRQKHFDEHPLAHLLTRAQ